jgi:hypothetical protein
MRSGSRSTNTRLTFDVSLGMTIDSPPDIPDSDPRFSR